ncbi:unnamed protein product, partial [Prorocentrum cordatum]
PAHRPAFARGSPLSGQRGAPWPAARATSRGAVSGGGQLARILSSPPPRGPLTAAPAPRLGGCGCCGPL